LAGAAEEIQQEICWILRKTKMEKNSLSKAEQDGL
jgi:hypothetical protein